MAQCKQTPQDFIRNAFTPQIAVLSTQAAEECCAKNNLSFIELLQPFSKLNKDVSYREPNGSQITIPNLKLSFLDVKSRPPQPTVARKYLNSSVSEAVEPRNQFQQVGEHKLDIPSWTPWYECWREAFLQVQYPSDHEYTKHYLACVLVVSSNEPEPVESMHQLVQQVNQMQNTAPGKLPKWFSSNVLKYYVIVQDVLEGNPTSAQDSYNTLKNSYGTNCFLLKTNSRPQNEPIPDTQPDPWAQFVRMEREKDLNSTKPENVQRLEVGQEASEGKVSPDYHPLSPDSEEAHSVDLKQSEPDERQMEKLQLGLNEVHGRCLTSEDQEQIKLLVWEIARSCLVPYVASQMALLSEAVANKKGVSKSLFSATKRWFSANKPGSAAIVNNLIYATDAPELQVRKLADLYFMFGHYAGAFQAYHLAKRDYNADQAWLYYAGALEMAALAAFMAQDSNRKSLDYMEEAINTYLSTCKMPQFATRATVLSAECLKAKSLFGDAALHLIRMTSEDSDLRSALLLEQAAYCFLQSKMVRKYAFHMVMAGNRFSKAAQRKHSLRCYKQAFTVYDKTGWDLASDHIHYTIGRQANNLLRYEEAVHSFSNLLTESSKQTAQQQALYLKEYLTILSNKLSSDPANTDTSLPILPVPQLEAHSVKVLLGPTRPLSTPGKSPALGVSFATPDDPQLESKWNRLEEMLVTEASGTTPMVFKPMITLYTISRIQPQWRSPAAVIGEPIQVQVTLCNSLQTVLNLKDVYLIWSFTSDSGVVTLNEERDVEDCVKTHKTKNAIIEGNQKLDVTLVLTPLLTGTITILGLCYTVHTSDTIYIKGKKTLDVPSASSLEISVVPSAPCLQVTFSENCLDYLTNELQRITVDFQNTGSVPLCNVLMATTSPNLLSSCEFREQQRYPGPDVMSRDKWARKNHITSVPLPDDRLEPGKTATMHLWLKAPPQKGPASVDLLIYYENVDPKAVPKYRLVRHTWNLTVQDSISLELQLQESHHARTVEELVMTLKTTNLNKVHSSISTEVTLLNVGLLSQHWKLRKNIMTPGYINLSTQESAYIFLKSRRVKTEVSKFSQVQLYSQDVHLPNLNSACLSFALKTEQYHFNVLTEDGADKQLYKDGMLFLQWQALVTDANNKKLVYGQNVIPLEINRNKPALITKEVDAVVVDINDKISEKLEENEMKMLQRQIVYSLHFPSQVQHDFKSKKLCLIEVRLLLHNVTDSGDVTVTINTIDACVPNNYQYPNIAYPLASSHFQWLGKGKIVRQMKALSTCNIKLHLVVANAGTFNLGSRLEVFCSKPHGKPILQTCEMHSSLIVTC